MKVGRHTIEIESEVCETDRHPVRLLPNQSTLSVTHICRFKNAMLYIESAGDPLEIRDKDDPSQRLLGSTNQTISLPMKKKETQKNLLIRVADDRFENLRVDLRAGKDTRKQFSKTP